MWDEGGSQGKGVHPTNNGRINKELEKRTNEEKDWGITKTKSRTPIGSKGISTLG
jgi:hypothetical protein